jgi:hypothetical protein
LPHWGQSQFLPKLKFKGLRTLVMS